MDNQALVLLSGGQDSTTCLYWALEKFYYVEALSFAYGQRHSIELDAAKTIARYAGVWHRIIELRPLGEVVESALTDPTKPIKETSKLPTSFVPGRNLIFLSYAAAYTYHRKIPNIVIGVNQEDYSGYPDCRKPFIDSMGEAIMFGVDLDIELLTPLMALKKMQIVELAREVGALEALAFSHTCYEGQYPPCGECPACKLRAKGFKEAGIQDPLLERWEAERPTITGGTG